MGKLLQTIGWAWLILIWIVACISSASSERIGWLVLWILLPPLAWAAELLLGVIHCFIDPAVGILIVVGLGGPIPLIIAGMRLDMKA